MLISLNTVINIVVIIIFVITAILEIKYAKRYDKFIHTLIEQNDLLKERNKLLVERNKMLVARNKLLVEAIRHGYVIGKDEK